MWQVVVFVPEHIHMLSMHMNVQEIHDSFSLLERKAESSVVSPSLVVISRPEATLLILDRTELCMPLSAWFARAGGHA